MVPLERNFNLEICNFPRYEKRFTAAIFCSHAICATNSSAISLMSLVLKIDYTWAVNLVGYWKQGLSGLWHSRRETGV